MRNHFIWLAIVIIAAAALGGSHSRSATAGPRELASYTFNNAEIQNVLPVLARHAGVEVVTRGILHERVTLKIHEVPPLAALFLVVRNCGYKWDLQGQPGGHRSLIVEEREPTLTEPAAAITRPQNASRGDSFPIPLEYIRAKDAARIIEEVFPVVKLQVNEEQNYLDPRGPSQQLRDVKEFAQILDEASRPVPSRP